MTADRAPGFYWVEMRRLAEPVVLQMKWHDGCEYWLRPGVEGDVDEDTFDVLAGPLQAPRIGPGEDIALFEAAEDIEPGNLVSLDLSGNKIRKTPLVPIVPPLDANVAMEASIAAYWRRRYAIVAGALERLLDAEFVAATTLKRRARALLEGTTPGPWETIEDIGDCPMMILGNKRAAVPGRLETSTCVASLAHDDADADAAFMVGAHALLTELAKEGE